MPLERDKLKTQGLQEQFKPETLPTHDRFGVGYRYHFESTLVDIYPAPSVGLPMIVVRGRRTSVFLGDAVKVEATENKGLRIKHVDGEVMVDPNGNYAALYTAPVEPEIIPFQEAYAVLKKQGKDGETTYTQHMLAAPDAKEGERMEKFGTVEATPKPVNKAKTSPLQFYLLVDDPEKEGGQERLEVYSTKATKQKVQGLKLVQGDKIHAVLYKHTWTDQTIGGDTLTSTRYNLTTILEVKRKNQEQNAKRLTRRVAEKEQ
jgi:hypothetical protein